MLHNLLPKIKTVTLLEDKDKGERKRQEEWRYCAEAKATSTRILNIADTSGDDESHIAFHTANIHPKPEPNVHYIEPRLLPDIDAPLNKTNRGIRQVAVLDDSIIQRQKPIINKPIRSVRPVEPVSSSLVVNMINLCPNLMELFVQRNRTILHSTVPAESQCSRQISGERSYEEGSYYLDSSESNETTSTFLFSSVRHATVTISNRQDIRTFMFSPKSKIGLEVEMWGGLKLIVSSVLEGHQAYKHKTELDGAEIIALNGKRVETFEQFRTQLEYVRRHYKDIVLQVAAYRDGKGKLDDFILNKSKNASVKSLFSNVMMYGLDLEHQYDMDVPSPEGEAVTEEASADEKSQKEKASPEEKKARGKKSSKKKAKYFYDSDEEDDRSSGSIESEGSIAAMDIDSGEIHKHGIDEVHSNIEQVKEKSERQDFNAVSSDSYCVEKNPEHSIGIESGCGTPILPSVGNSLNGDIDMDDDNALLAARNKPLKLDQTDVSLAQSSVRAIEMENLSSGQTEDVDESSQWDFPTAVDTGKGQRIPCTKLVCVPDHLRHSASWGDPTKFIQISNFSSNWELELFWVDSNGFLVPRAEINRLRSTHIEQASSDHVWVVLANVVKDRRRGIDTSMYEGSLASAVADSSIDNSVHNSSVLTSTMMIIRPSVSSLAVGKCTSIIWSPEVSVSATQRMHSAKSTKGDAPEFEPDDGKENVNPHMHIQVFDGPAKRASSANSVNSTLFDDDDTSVDFNSAADTNNIFINPKLYKKSFKSMLNSRRC